MLLSLHRAAYLLANPSVSSWQGPPLPESYLGSWLNTRYSACLVEAQSTILLGLVNRSRQFVFGGRSQGLSRVGTELRLQMVARVDEKHIAILCHKPRDVNLTIAIRVETARIMLSFKITISFAKRTKKHFSLKPLLSPS